MSGNPVPISSFSPGSISGTAWNCWKADAWVDYVYSRDPLFDRAVEDLTGLGVSADLALQWDWRANWHLAIQALDLLSYLRWNQAPHTAAQAQSQAGNGQQVGFDPMLSGIEDERRHSQQFEPRWQAGLEWQGAIWRTRLEGYRQASFDGYALGLGRDWAGLGWQLRADPRLHSLTLELQHPWFLLRYGADKLDMAEARYLDLALALRLAF